MEEFEITYKQEGERFSCHISKIDVYFSAIQESEIVKKAKTIIEMWIKFHVERGEEINMVR